MQQKVQNYIEKHELLTPKGRVIVGVSGGADSVALLHLLVSLGYDCIIAHCNFHLRMEESDRDEAFVLNLSKDLKIPYYSIDFDTIKYADTHHISIEMAARDLRYAWFYELLEKQSAQAIAVAHHADDGIETMLMNLIRGTGLRGLTGISARNEKVVRPLLCCTRKEIENYIITHDLEHIEDSTNATPDYQRNKFRNVVLPLLEEINPSVRQTLYDSLERFEGNLAIYEQAIEKIKNAVVIKESETVKLNIDLLKQQADVPTVMYELLHSYGFGAATIKQITEQLDGESGKQFYSETHRLLKDRKYLIISKIESKTDDVYWIQETDTEIMKPIHLKLSKLQLNPHFQVSKEKNCVHIDAAKLQFPLQLRRWHEGDTFFPFGMKNRKKVSDFFIDNKLNLLEKEQSWLLISGEDIVWIVGQRMDNRFRVTEKTIDVSELNVHVSQVYPHC
ncbi:MAG TPA: tRNA lysidine(34) synthetase TilS [Paludibacter sp.]